MPASALRFLGLAVCCLVLPLSSLSAQQPAARKVAFLVSVGKYKHIAAQLGGGPGNDVDELGALLKAGGYDVTTVTNENATHDEILKQFERVLNGQKNVGDAKNALGVSDQLLFFFSGHGIQANSIDHLQTDPKPLKKNQPFFCVHDSMATRTATMIPFNAILRQVEDHKVRAMFLVDACRDEIDEQFLEKSIDGNSVTMKHGMSIMFSCQNDQKSIQDVRLGKAGHGLFTYAILQTLRGETNKEGEVSWDDLVADVKRNFTRGEMGEKLKKANRAQIPKAASGETSDTVLLTVKARVAIVKEPKPGEERSLDIGNGLKMVFCYIPAGECQLGSPRSEQNDIIKQVKPDGSSPILREIELLESFLKEESDTVRSRYKTKGFWMAKYAITQEEWTAAMKTNPSSHCGNGSGKDKVVGLDTSRFPVENVTWDDCKSLVNKLNVHLAGSTVFGNSSKLVLPHEDQWEYAYRCGKTNRQPYYWGDALNGDKANCDGNFPFGTLTAGEKIGRPMPVGSYEIIARHPWGLCDMSGNVFQWCDNKYSDKTDQRVLRGGAWYSHSTICRAAFRLKVVPGYRNDGSGCRLCVIND